MEFDFYIKEDTAVIKRCLGSKDKIRIPDRLGGYPVGAVGDYAFSDTVKVNMGQSHENQLSGASIRQVQLPWSVKTLGRYVFYGCRYLERLILTQNVEEIGAGAFTGCTRLEQLEIRMNGGNAHCLKDIIGELNQELEVTLDYGTGKAVLFFPEYYEEAVENTPARMLETHFHGSGYKYRQCFKNKEFNFIEYDSLFKEAIAWEEPLFCIKLALTRLKYPEQLMEKYRIQYEAYLKKNQIEAGIAAIEQKRMDQIEFLGTIMEWDEKSIPVLIQKSSACVQTEMVGYFMDYKHEHHSNKQKSFEL